MIGHSPRLPHLASVLLACSLIGSTSCKGEDGDQGPPGPPGDPGTETELSQGDELPGLHVVVQSMSGGSASGGRFRVGDTPRVNFRIQKADGSDWDISELSSGRALLSGPTFNYQRVIEEQTDLVTAAVEQSDGSYTYTFPVAIPSTYLAPFNDTPAFGADAGELAGQALLEGTYTVGLTFSWDFTVDGESERDSGNATFDFVLGESGSVEPREVVTIENCNRCHDNLEIHGGRRQDVSLCVMCHTSGAEDSNDPSVGGGTPGVSIDFKVMIHKIHAGQHLPSVLGVATNDDGTRNYDATPQPYMVSDHDYSEVGFPAWPHGLVPMPRDEGYSLLASEDKATEDTIRKGPSNCAVCHGDPDDEGPLSAPAQGDLHRTQPKKEACGSCHDDVHWGKPYRANSQTMGAQANNSNCKLCHAPSGNPLAVLEGHLHPLLDPSFNEGVNIAVSDVSPAGADDGDDALDPGEKLSVTFEIVDDSGAAIAPADVSSPSVVFSGPTSNYNLLLNTTLPAAALTGPAPYTVNVPMQVDLERLDVSTAALESFTTAFAPHWNVTGALTQVLVRTANSGGDSVLSADSAAPQNYVDVADAAGFDRNDLIVVDDGQAEEEYAKIQYVEGNRLWFSSPYTTSYKAGLATAHGAGATVRGVDLATKTLGVDYSLDAETGTITELIEFGDGLTVISSYWTDFVAPEVYPLSLNDSPDLAEASGEWTGKSLVDGTYSLGIWTSRSLTLELHGESNSYRSTAEAESTDILVGAATELEPYDLIASGSSCFNCHQELAFHGFGRKDFNSCVLCHGTSGAEDRPQYVAGNAPPTQGATVSFRTMLHKIHMGAELSNASTYELIGHGSGAYPNNFGVVNYGHVAFPSFPGGTANCVKCHDNDAWHEPKPRAHPTEQGTAIGRWTAVCGACHDSTDAQAHIAVQTDPSGNESCGVCHGPDEDLSVELVHKTY
jgi:OmcA/MtrC family decaheme c-type cytochrome